MYLFHRDHDFDGQACFIQPSFISSVCMYRLNLRPATVLRMTVGEFAVIVCLLDATNVV